LNKKGQLTATASPAQLRGVPKFYDWLRLRLSTAAAETFYGWLRLMNSTAAYGGGLGVYTLCREKRDQNVFYNISYKTRLILMKFGR